MAGSWRMMITKARPKVKPRSTGLAMKADNPPIRATPAIRKNAPVSNTSPMASASRWVASPPASKAVVAASTAAEEEVAETMAKRLRPTRP